MKITPDYKGRNDGYDDNTVRFWESVKDDFYYYELYVLVDGIKSRIIVTDGGVSVESIEGSTLHTNIVPEALFGKRESLEWKHLRHIIRILENTGLEGMTRSKEEMDALYERWKRETGGE